MKKILFLFILIAFSSCASRTPNTHTAEKIIHKYFKKYAKKYPESEFGKAAVEKIEVGTIQESQRRVAQAQANLSLSSGEQISILMGFIYKAPLGWRAQSWEKLTLKSPTSASDSSKKAADSSIPK